MKKLITFLMMALAIFAISCADAEKVTGPKGDKGDTGSPGADGKTSMLGTDIDDALDAAEVTIPASLVGVEVKYSAAAASDATLTDTAANAANYPGTVNDFKKAFVDAYNLTAPVTKGYVLALTVADLPDSVVTGVLGTVTPPTESLLLNTMVTANTIIFTFTPKAGSKILLSGTITPKVYKVTAALS